YAGNAWLNGYPGGTRDAGNPSHPCDARRDGAELNPRHRYCAIDGDGFDGDVRYVSVDRHVGGYGQEEEKEALIAPAHPIQSDRA
ncbi:MAG TPA: hypothetical protein VN137_00180, partial [Sphingomonas sp.]|nr:hypothetical protein [Sphingomonas sp.]